jgi:hypothetical protein
MVISTEPHRSPVFSANLEALRGVDGELVERLCLPVDGSHVQQRSEGPPLYRVHRYFQPFVVPDDRRAASIGAVDGTRPVLLFGAGVGEQLAAVIERFGELPVTVWDRDPWLLRHLLASGDLRERLADGRLRLRLGVDLIDLHGDVDEHAVVEHPFLGEVYRYERALLRDGIGQRRALLRSGTLFVDDLAAALAAEGYSIYTLDTERLSVEELEFTVRRFRPDLLAAINYADGTAEFCQAVGCDLLCWEIDPTTSRLRPLAAPPDRAHLFTYRRQNVELFEAAGFQQVEYLPLAADTDRRRPLVLTPDDRVEYGAPVSYVGASMVAEGLEFRQRFVERFARWASTAGADPAGGAALLGEVLARQRRDLSRYCVVEALEELGGSFLADERAGDQLEDPAMLVAEIAASEKRLTYVANLASFDVVVWGDVGWNQVARFGARYSGRYARHSDELTRIYNASTINVDIGRLYQSDIVTMRVFDVLACGGFLLAEHSDALAELFQIGEEVESYHTLAELRAKVAHYLQHPEDAALIARRGLRAVRERHTIPGRVRHMLDRMGRPPRPEGV